MPGTFEPIDCSTVTAGLTSVISEKSILSTTFPTARRCVPPAVPVTTISSSASASPDREKSSTCADPGATVTVRSCPAYPISWTRTV